MFQSRGWAIGMASMAGGFLGGVAVTLALGGRRLEVRQDVLCAGQPDEAPASPMPGVDLPSQSHDAPPSDDMSASDAAVLLAAIEAAQDPLSGPPPQWPESPAYQADFVRTSLGRAFPETDISLDCQEFPCIGVIETGTDVPAELAADLQAHGFPRNGRL